MGSNKPIFNFSKIVGRKIREKKFGRKKVPSKNSKHIEVWSKNSRHNSAGSNKQDFGNVKFSVEKIETYRFLVELVETHLKGRANKLFENFHPRQSRKPENLKKPIFNLL